MCATDSCICRQSQVTIYYTAFSLEGQPILCSDALCPFVQHLPVPFEL